MSCPLGLICTFTFIRVKVCSSRGRRSCTITLMSKVVRIDINKRFLLVCLFLLCALTWWCKRWAWPWGGKMNEPVNVCGRVMSAAGLNQLISFLSFKLVRRITEITSFSAVWHLTSDKLNGYNKKCLKKHPSLFGVPDYGNKTSFCAVCPVASD